MTDTGMRGRRIGVLAGGLSEEAGVSLVSGQGVVEALRSVGCDAHLVVLDHQDPGTVLKESGIEVAFPVTHGIYGEDGCLQGVLEWMGIPYVGSGVLSSALAMNKTVANAILKTRGLPVPEGVTIDTEDPDALSKINAALAARPVCIKPNAGGSSVGIELVDEPADRAAALARIAKVAKRVLVEEKVEGVEVTVGTLDDRPLGSTEIEPLNSFYDFHHKYTKGASRYHSPARIPAEQERLLMDWAGQAIRALGCSGGCRVDFIVGPGRVALLEVNTLPGMTAMSLLPMCAGLAGISYEQLCLQMLDRARLERQPREAPTPGA